MPQAASLLSESSIAVPLNDVFQVSFKANPQNGYLWYPDEDQNAQLKDLGIQFLEEKTEPLPGYTGCKQHFSYKGTERTQAIIHFIYKRSWETDPYFEEYIQVSIV